MRILECNAPVHCKHLLLCDVLELVGFNAVLYTSITVQLWAAV
jgi:hypothetical protein